MKNLDSNADDCLSLALLLERNLKEKIEFYGSVHLEVVSGKYHSLPYKAYNRYADYKKDEVAFSYKFCENEFLRITVGDSIYNRTTGHKLAVLSDFYEVLSEVYGIPTLFYTIKDDDEKSLNLQWSFCQKEEDIESFKNGTMFDDGEIDELIIIDEPKEKSSVYQLSEATRQMISRQVGVPFELIYLVDENIEEFLKYKKGEKIGYPDFARIDGYKIATPESIEGKIEKLKESSDGPTLVKRGHK